MPQVYIKSSCEYEWLRGCWFVVYGWNVEKDAFLIWDSICDEWVLIPVGDCEGQDFEKTS